MRNFILKPRLFSVVLASAVLNVAASSQAPANSEPPANTDTHWTVAPYGSAPADKNPTITAGAFSLPTTAGDLKEDQLKQLLVGKTLYLRDGYLDNNLEFDEFGKLAGKSAQGSFTLSQIEINKVKLSKHKLELQGDRYGLHFLGAAPFEDPTKATDRVKITPKKKTVRISFDREQVEKPKKEKKHKYKGDRIDQPEKSEAAAAPAQPAEVDDTVRKGGREITKTTSPAHASQLLLGALDKVFAIGIDDRMITAMPDFWRLYYQAAAAKTDFKPADPGIFRQNAVELKAKLNSAIDPPSNQFAQSSGIAGMALYHAVVGPDGKVQQVIAGRPIGFGLDENAEKTIRAATFQPALKEGKPVPVSLDLIVSFRIYSRRTSQSAAQVADDKPASLPGPYTAKVLEARGQQPQAAQQQDASTQPAQPTSPQ